MTRSLLIAGLRLSRGRETMSGLRILVVEDDPFNAELLAELLGNLGHT